MKLQDFLGKHPDVYPSPQNRTGLTPLHLACSSGHAAVATILVSHPDIDLDEPNFAGHTPLHLAAGFGRLPAVKVLLQCPLNDLNPGDRFGCTPLWCAVRRGHISVVRWMLMLRGHQLDLNLAGHGVTPIQLATDRGFTQIVSLLTAARADLGALRNRLRGEEGHAHAAAVELFATMVLVSDDFFRLGPDTPALSAARRFFVTILQLPMELQMIIAFRVYGSARVNVLSGEVSRILGRDLFS